MKVEEYLKHVNMKVTDEIRKFVDESVFGNSEYMFFSKDKCYCTKCNTELKPVKLTHNDGTICPACGTKLTAKNTKFGKKNCLNEACFYYFEKSIIDPKVVVCKGYYVSKDYAADYKNPYYYYDLCAAYIFKEKEAVMLRNSYWSGSWTQTRSIYDFNINWLANKMCHCSFESIGTAIKDTAFQYMPYEIFQGYYSMVKVFDEYIKHPWIEQICKIGFDNIIREKLDGKHIYGCLNYKGKNIFKILRINKKDLKEIRESKVKISPLFLKMYQLQAKDNSGLTAAEIKEIESDYGYRLDKFTNVIKYTTMKKAVKYMEKQYKKYKRKLYGKSDTLVTFSDYIDDCQKLSMDLQSEHILFPKDVYTAHQHTITQISVKENKDLDKKIAARASSLKKYKFEHDGLLIRPALSTGDLIIEGTTLCHCVATNYTKPYAEGKTNIFFVRRIEEPDVPFCTVEIKNNMIKQAYIKHDQLPDKKTKEFLDLYTNIKLKKIGTVVEKVRISA